MTTKKTLKSKRYRRNKRMKPKTPNKKAFVFENPRRIDVLEKTPLKFNPKPSIGDTKMLFEDGKTPTTDNINKIMLQHSQDNIKPMTDEEILNFCWKELKSKGVFKEELIKEPEFFFVEELIKRAIQLTRQSEQSNKYFTSEQAERYLDNCDEILARGVKEGKSQAEAEFKGKLETMKLIEREWGKSQADKNWQEKIRSILDLDNDLDSIEEGYNLLRRELQKLLSEQEGNKNQE